MRLQGNLKRISLQKIYQGSDTRSQWNTDHGVNNATLKLAQMGLTDLVQCFRTLEEGIPKINLK